MKPASIRIGYPWWLRLFLQKNVVAITLGRRIYFRDPDPDARLMKHEMTHVEQVNRYGLPLFLARYGYEFTINLVRERSFDRAYRAISFEKEAFAAEDL